MSPSADRWLRQVDAVLDPEEITELAQRLVTTPSFAADHGWERGVATILADVLAHEGLVVQRQPVQDDRSNLLATLPGERAGWPLLMLNGHMDTVPPTSSMAEPPFAGVLRDGRLWGRGAADMKGGLAAMAAALIALRRVRPRLPAPVVLAAVVGEESGNIGTVALAHAHGGPPAHYAVVGEPTDLGVVIAHRGVDRYRVTVAGKAAHGSTPERGENAILRAARLLAALDDGLIRAADAAEAHPFLGKPSYNVGTIRGGTSRNTVPDRCTFQIEKRWLPGDEPARIEAALRATANKTLGRGGVEIVREPEYEAIERPPLELPAGHALAQTCRRAVEEVTGRPARLLSFPAFTDGAILQAAGTPAVICGPGSIHAAHADDESVSLGELHLAARVYATLAVRLAAAFIGG